MCPKFSLAIEYISFFRDKKIINRIVYKVRFTRLYGDIIIHHKGDMYSEKKVMKHRYNKIIVEPRTPYTKFIDKVLQHFSERLHIKSSEMNLRWIKRPPMIWDVVNFKWRIR